MALLGAVLLLLTSCGSPSYVPLGGIDLLRPRPVITVPQARRVFDMLVSERAVALHAGNAPALTGVETQPLLESDRGVLASEQHLYMEDGIGSTFTSVTPFVPRSSSYPAWFMVEARTGWGRILALVTRTGPNQQWKLGSAALLPQQLPSSPEPAAGSFVQPGRYQRNLSADLSNYFNAGENEGKTRNVLAGRFTSAIVQDDLQWVSQNDSNGWSVQTSFSPRPFSFSQGLRLRNGGVLGFAAIGRQFTVSAPNGSCFQEDATRGGWSTTGGSGMAYSVTVNGINLFAVIESKAGDKVIGALGEVTTTDMTTC